MFEKARWLFSLKFVCPCSYPMEQRRNFWPNFSQAHEYFTDDKVNHSKQVLFAKKRYNHVTVWNCHLCINGLCRHQRTGSVNRSGLRGVLGIPLNPFTSKGSPSMGVCEWMKQNESAALVVALWASRRNLLGQGKPSIIKGKDRYSSFAGDSQIKLSLSASQMILGHSSRSKLVIQYLLIVWLNNSISISPQLYITLAQNFVLTWALAVIHFPV